MSAAAADDEVAPTGSALLDVVAVMDRLRAPGGCPWDAEQTHTSLTRYLVEETYEVLDAVEALDGTPGPETDLAEELGDVLLQVVFHARVAAERGAFDVDDVARALSAKLRRRHPHVFGAASQPVRGADGPTTGEEVQARWDELKAAEKPSRGPVDGIPLHLPALARADALLARLDRAGIPLADVTAAAASTATATATATNTATNTATSATAAVGAGTTGADPTADAAQAQLGAELLALVVRARAAGVDAEAALRDTVRSLQRAAAGGVP